MIMKYWQKVRVKSWFYEGLEWKLHFESASNDWSDRDSYGVLIHENAPHLMRVLTFLKTDLEIIL